jgi:cullin 1
MPPKPSIGLEEGWAKLQTSIDQLIEVCENDFPPQTDMSQVMANYTLVYQMAVQRPPNNHCEALYERHKQVYVDYLTNKVVPQLREAGGAFMLAEIGKRWINHRDVMVKWNKKFFLYLDQFYTKREKLPNIYDTGMIAFKETMFPMVKDDVTTAILEYVAEERAGKSIDRSLLKSVVDLFVQMGLGQMDVYRDGFEGQFLDTSASYYSRLAAEKASVLSMPEYIKMCAHQLDLETTRVANYLHEDTEEKLVKVVKKEMLEVHQAAVMEKPDSGLVVVFGEALPFADADPSMVALVYKLYKDLPTGLEDERLPEVTGKPALTQMLFEHIKKIGTAEVEAQKAKSGEEGGGKEFIERLVAIHKHYATMFDEHCEGDKDFHDALKRAYAGHIINNKDILTDPHFVPRLLSEYCDFFLLKANSRTVEPEDAHNSLASAVTMYSYLEDKDYFNQHYKRSLANRLLHDTTIGTEQEDQFLTMVKQRCGAMWTRNQEAMIRDIKMSDSKHKDNFEAFRKVDAGCAAFEKTAVAVRLLNERMWPAFKEDKLTAPSALQQVIDGFDRYYEAHQSTQEGAPKIQLNWLLTQGNATVKPVYGGKSKGFGHSAFRSFKMELVNPYQLAILLLFNIQDKWTAPQLEAQLSVESSELKKYLTALTMNKYKALRARTVDGSKMEEAQFSQLVFEVNAKLPAEVVDKKSKKSRPKVRYDMGRVDAAQVEKEVDMSIQEERRFIIDCALVKALKAERKMNVAVLIPQVCMGLNDMFQAHPPFVRKRVELLIDQEFFKKDADDPRVLHYIA